MFVEIKANNFIFFDRKFRMSALTLDSLHVLDAIERSGSFAAAAKELFRVPSTISYAVSKLEEDLGVRVFDRAGPRVTLTPAGRALLDEGRPLLLAALQLEHKVRRVARGWETEFAIATDVLFSPVLLAPEIRDFYTAADSTRLRLSQEALSGTWEVLLDGRADLVVGAAGEGPPGGGYRTELIGQVRFLFVVAPSHPLAAIDRPLNKADLMAHRMISVADSARRLPAGGAVSRRYLPVSSPLASGKNGSSPRPNRSQAGMISTSASRWSRL